MPKECFDISNWLTIIKNQWYYCTITQAKPVEKEENGDLSPLRLLILAILFYIAYRLLAGGRQKKEPDLRQNKTDYKEMPANDVLVEDPVCKKMVPRQQALQHHHADQIIYFCSEECCRKFISQQGESE